MTKHLPREYRFLRGLVSVLIWAFFKEVAREGASRVPENSGGLIVAWHPNGLVDPAALIKANFLRRIVFGARHGLFKLPIVGRIMRRLGTIPIYRSGDVSDKNRRERLAANEEGLDALARELAAGSFSALFPEGISHDMPHLSDIKTGAAGLYFRSVDLAGANRSLPAIIPVGLHYDRKDIFRSRVLVRFHRPMQLPPELLTGGMEQVDAKTRRERYRELTDEIQQTLVKVARATNDWDLHFLMHRLRKLVRAERASRAGVELRPPDIAEWELGFALRDERISARPRTVPASRGSSHTARRPTTCTTLRRRKRT